MTNPLAINPDIDFTDYKIIGDGAFSMGLPYETDPKLILNVFAGAKAYLAGIKSIDYCRKRYGKYWKFSAHQTPSERLVRETVCFCKKYVESTYENINAIQNKPDKIGLILAGTSMARLRATIFATGILLKLGYLFETQALTRIMLEQIAWAYAAHEIEDDTVFKISSHQAIGKLKHLIPWAGQLYGTLSDMSHIKPNLKLAHIRPSGKEFQVILTSQQNSLLGAMTLLRTVDCFGIVFEYLFKDLIHQHSCLQKTKTGFILNKNRPFLKKARKYDDKLHTHIAKTPFKRKSEHY